MVYHEIRNVDGKKLNYLISNQRKNGKWVKKSKFIGYGDYTKKKISALKKLFTKEFLIHTTYQYLSRIDTQTIENLKELYHKKIDSMQKEEYQVFEKNFFTELTYNSNAIEGSSLTLAETSLLVNQGIVPAGKQLREIYEAKNHIEALHFIRTYKGNFNEQFILKIHSMILKNISERFAGRYRETSVRIFGSDVVFPESTKVPQLIGNLIYWYNKNKKNYHPFELAALVSLKLVTIHPFVDGNGRVSRLVMNFLLQKNNYPWINIYNKHRQQYLTAVRKANDEDYTLIFPFLITTLRTNLKDFNIL